jgi:hypothetical protein
MELKMHVKRAADFELPAPKKGTLSRYSLPYDIWQIIFKMTISNYKTYVKLASVCKQWKYICRKPEMIAYLFRKNYIPVAIFREVLLKECASLKGLKLKWNSRCCRFAELSRFNIHSLYISPGNYLKEKAFSHSTVVKLKLFRGRNEFLEGDFPALEKLTICNCEKYIPSENFGNPKFKRLVYKGPEFKFSLHQLNEEGLRQGVKIKLLTHSIGQFDSKGKLKEGVRFRAITGVYYQIFEVRNFIEKPEGTLFDDNFTARFPENESGNIEGKNVPRYLREDGSWYCGDWVDGFYEGDGTLIDERGFILKGTFRGGELVKGTVCEPIDETGRRTYGDGSVYEGAIIEGKREGIGRMIYSDKYMWVGKFVNNVPQGPYFIKHRES